MIECEGVSYSLLLLGMMVGRFRLTLLIRLPVVVTCVVVTCINEKYYFLKIQILDELWSVEV